MRSRSSSKANVGSKEKDPAELEISSPTKLTPAQAGKVKGGVDKLDSPQLPRHMRDEDVNREFSSLLVRRVAALLLFLFRFCFGLVWFGLGFSGDVF